MVSPEEGENKSGSQPSEDETLAEWEAMLAEDEQKATQPASDNTANANPDSTSGNTLTPKATRILNQDEIDSLLGFEAQGDKESNNKGIRAMLDRALLQYERLPMLEIVFDRFVRMLSTSLRNFTSDNVDIDIRGISSLRFGDYINSIPMPALLTVFKAVEWENYGIITADGSLIYSLVDILFGGRKTNRPIRFEGRPYTTIEQGIVKQLSDLILLDLGASFDQLSPATFIFERLETNPRFATIARTGDAAILLQLRVEMEERGGKIEVLFPYATLEPIRELLLQVFMGEKFGKDNVWEMHIHDEILNTPIELEAILNSKSALIRDIMQLKVGSTIIMDNLPEDDIIVHCKGHKMVTGRLGRVDNKIAVSVNKIFNKIVEVK